MPTECLVLRKEYFTLSPANVRIASVHDLQRKTHAFKYFRTKKPQMVPVPPAHFSPARFSDKNRRSPEGRLGPQYPSKEKNLPSFLQAMNLEEQKLWGREGKVSKLIRPGINEPV